MPVTLDQILDETRQRVAAAKAETPQSALAEMGAKRAMRGFRKALLKASADGPAIIAELKQASPSKGVLRGVLHVGGVAMSLEQNGAAALSVLTEEKYFKGSLGNMREASAASLLPILRKDFMIDEYQVWEAKAFGADAILLIATCLNDEELPRLYSLAKQLELDVICEVHDEDDLTRVQMLGADIIGVNSRDLQSLQVDLATHHRLFPLLPQDALRIAESGIRTGTDIRTLRAHGYQAFLVGEQLMEADDPGSALSQMLGEAKSPPLGSGGVPSFTVGTKD